MSQQMVRLGQPVSWGILVNRCAKQCACLHLFLDRSKNRRHPSTFHPGFLVNFCDIREFFQKTPQEIHSVVFIDDVPAPKLYVCSHFITVKKKFTRVFCLEIKIVDVRVRAESDFLQLDIVGFLPSFFFFFLLFVPEFSVIHDLADRWIGVRGDFNEIKVSFICKFDSVFEAVNAVFTSGIDDTNIFGTDLVVNTNSFLCDGNTGLFKWRTKYTV